MTTPIVREINLTRRPFNDGRDGVLRIMTSPRSPTLCLTSTLAVRLIRAHDGSKPLIAMPP